MLLVSIDCVIPWDAIIKDNRIRINLRFWFVKENRPYSGKIFCMEEKIKIELNFIYFIILIVQKWKGAAPNFTISLSVSSVLAMNASCICNRRNVHNITLELNAWIIKYFIMILVFSSKCRKARNVNILSSINIQNLKRFFTLIPAKIDRSVIKIAIKELNLGINKTAMEALNCKFNCRI